MGNGFKSWPPKDYTFVKLVSISIIAKVEEMPFTKKKKLFIASYHKQLSADIKCTISLEVTLVKYLHVHQHMTSEV